VLRFVTDGGKKYLKRGEPLLPVDDFDYRNFLQQRVHEVDDDRAKDVLVKRRARGLRGDAPPRPGEGRSARINRGRFWGQSAPVFRTE
jgi:hypothetical protein